jgi:hypothetical protein
VGFGNVDVRPQAAPAAVGGRELAFALLAAFCVRLLMTVFVDIKLANDAATYVLMARNLLEHGTFSHDLAPPYLPSAYRPPLYPAMLAIVFAVAGHSLLAVQLVQIGISLFTVWILFRCVGMLQPEIGRWSLWLLALAPFDAVYSVAFLSEGFTSFFLSAGLATWAVMKSRWRWLVLGGAFGFATLCRDIYIALPPFFAFTWLLLGAGRIRERVRAGALVIAATLLVVSTWSIRNALVLEKWVPVTAGRLGMSLWMGSWAIDFRNVQEKDGRKIFPAEAYLDEAERHAHERLMQQADAAALDQFYRQSFFRRIEHEPLRVLGRWVARIPLLWLGTRFDIFDLNPRMFPYGSVQWNLAKATLFAVNASLVFLAACGIVLGWRRKSALRWWCVPILFTAAVYLPLNSFENRYSQPVYPLLLIFAAMTVTVGLRRRWHSEAHLAGT